MKTDLFFHPYLKSERKILPSGFQVPNIAAHHFVSHTYSQAFVEVIPNMWT